MTKGYSHFGPPAGEPTRAACFFVLPRSSCRWPSPEAFGPLSVPSPWGGVDPAWTPGAPQSRSVAPRPQTPSQLGWGEKIQQRARGSREGQGAMAHQLPSRAKQTQPGKLTLIWYQSTRVG